MIALCNSRAMGEASENSDIDLFVIAKKGNLWTARFIITALTTVLWTRRRNTHGLTKWSLEYIRRTKDKYCLSFFITEEAMNLDLIRLETSDPYLDKWMCTLVPIVNKNETYERFMQENWFDKRAKIKDKRDGFIKKFLSFILYPLSCFESFIKFFWLPHTLRTYEKLWKPWWVVISDTMLKFHDNDQRKVYFEEEKKLSEKEKQRSL